MLFHPHASEDSTEVLGLPLAVLVSLLALGFTVLSFWWLNARRGRLVSYEPSSFATVIRPDDMLLRLPLVLRNTGAVPLVVSGLRVYVHPPSAPSLLLPWRNSRNCLAPGGVGDTAVLPSVFYVPGRTAVNYFIEFGGRMDARSMHLRPTSVEVQALLAHKLYWTTLIEFPLHFEHVTYPDRYAAFNNTRGSVTDADQLVAAETFKRIMSNPGSSSGA